MEHELTPEEQAEYSAQFKARKETERANADRLLSTLTALPDSEVINRMRDEGPSGTYEACWMLTAHYGNDPRVSRLVNLAVKAKQPAPQATQRALKVKAEPARFNGPALPDPAKVAARKIVERELARPKPTQFQPSLMPDVPDETGQVSLF